MTLRSTAFLSVVVASCLVSCARDARNHDPEIAWATDWNVGVVVWGDESDEDSPLVYARYVDEGGRTVDPTPVPVGGAFTRDGRRPRVASNGEGFFIVYEQPTAEGSKILAMWYKGGLLGDFYLDQQTGLPYIDPIRISSGADALEPAVAYDAELNLFLVVWIERLPSLLHVKGRLYAPGLGLGAPTPVGDEYRISDVGNQNNSFGSKHPAVEGGGGEFLVAWTHAGVPVEFGDCDRAEDCTPEVSYCTQGGKCKTFGSLLLTRPVGARGPFGIPHVVVATEDVALNHPDLVHPPVADVARYFLVWEASQDRINGACLEAFVDPGGGPGYRSISTLGIAQGTSENHTRPSVTFSSDPGVTFGSRSTILWEFSRPDGSKEIRRRDVFHQSCEIAPGTVTVATDSCDSQKSRAISVADRIIVVRERDCPGQGSEIVSDRIRRDGETVAPVDVVSAGE